MNYILIIYFCIVILSVFLIVYFTLKSYLQHKDLNFRPKICWLYWDQDPMPDLLQKIKKYNRPKLVGWKVNYLNENNLKNYINPSEYPKYYSKLIQAHKADWIRLYLLNQYGGCWLDCSIIINNDKALNKIYQQSLVNNYDITLFQTSSDNKTFRHPSGIKIPLVLDNWFILAPQNSIIVKLWFREFSRAIKIGFLPYKKMVQKLGTDISKIYFKDENDVYLTQHVCLQHVLQHRTTIPKILFYNSYDSMLKLQKMCNNTEQCIQDKLNNDPAFKKIPFIKLTRHDRTNLNISKFFKN